MKKRYYILIMIIVGLLFSESSKKNALAVSIRETEQPLETQTPNEGEESGVSLRTIYSAVRQAYGENYMPTMSYDSKIIEEFFGIKSSFYEEAIAEGPEISAHIDTFIAIRAKEDKVKEVKRLLMKYREDLMKDTLQYTINIPKIHASKVIVRGNYVFFVMLGEIPIELEEQGKQAMMELANKNNQIAIDAIDKIMKKNK